MRFPKIELHLLKDVCTSQDLSSAARFVIGEHAMSYFVVDYMGMKK
jgi:hypothetical protein